MLANHNSDAKYMIVKVCVKNVYAQELEVINFCNGRVATMEEE